MLRNLFKVLCPERVLLYCSGLTLVDADQIPIIIEHCTLIQSLLHAFLQLECFIKVFLGEEVIPIKCDQFLLLIGPAFATGLEQLGL